jgi:Ca-activated chloride channel family protein
MESHAFPKKRERTLVAGALVAATMLAGAAARGTGSAPPADTSDGARRFTAASRGPVSFTGTLDKTAVLVGGEPTVRMELVIGGETRETNTPAHLPTDLVVVFDRSGSMAGEKIEHARAAIRELIGRLGPRDRFALVTYSSVAGIAIAPAMAENAAQEKWAATVAAIGPEGGTNMSSGLDLGIGLIEQIREPGRVPRAILISDGLANEGDPTLEGLVGRAARAARAEYMLTTIGVGADFNEYLMSALADAGTGNYYYLKNASDLGGVFAREFDAARATLASGLEVRIDPGDGVEVVDAAGYPLEQTGDAVVFRPGSLFAGQKRRVWVTLRVPNRIAGEHDLGRFSLAYRDGAERAVLAFGERPRVASVEREKDFYASVDVDSWTRSVVVDEYNKMQERVAREVKAGNRAAALFAVAAFRDETSTLNAQLQSPAVQEKLDSLGKLETEVASAFEGDDQPARQNELSKTRSADALDKRRAGSKR